MSETIRPDEPAANPTPISGKDIKALLPTFAILEKPNRDQMQKAIAECNVPPDIAKKLAECGRDDLHTLRMLRRSAAERSFSLAYLQYRDEIFAEDRESALSIREVICSEGDDTMMFWTFAPLSFRDLNKREMPNREGGNQKNP